MARRAEVWERASTAAREEPVWQVRSVGPLAGMRLALRSAWHGWRLLSAVTLGMIICVMLLSVVPIYSTLVTNTQIAAELRNADPTDRNMEVTAHVAPFWQVSLRDVDNSVLTARADALPAWLIGSSTEYVEAGRPFMLEKVNNKPSHTLLPQFPIGPRPPRGQLDLLTYNYAQAAPHMKIIAGRLPRPTPAGAPPEALVTPASTAKPGMLLTISDSVNAKRTFVVKVVGVWYPKDENDPFWNGRGFQTVTLDSGPPGVFPVLMERGAFERMLSFQPASLSESPLEVTAHYIWFVNGDAVTADNQGSVITGVQTLKNALNGEVLGANDVRSVGLATRVSDILGQGQNLFGLLRLPLYSVAAQLVVMALLFIVTMCGMLIESQAGEIATLRSRGASLTQILMTYVGQGIALAALAFLVGPLAAMALSLFVIIAFVPAAHASGATLTLDAVLRDAPWRQALRPALIGAGLGLLAVIVAAWQAARLDVLAFRRRQGRVDQAPFWQRYYLDLALTALVIAGYVQLSTYGALGTRALLASMGATSSFDLIQTLTPTMTLVVGALLILRVTPWFLRLGGWIAARGRGATQMLAFSQLSRASGAFNRLTLLLALSVGVGLFALAFQATVARSSVDEARYLVGGDERVVIKPPEEGTQLTGPYRVKFAHMPGVRGVTPLYRTYGLTTPDFNSGNVDILAVDPADFAQIAAWRSDYATQSLQSLMAKLKAGQQGANAGDSSHPMGALVNQTLAQAMSLHLGDKFQIIPHETLDSHPFQYAVIGVVNAFPTMYNEYPGGYLITNVNDYLAALGNPYLAGYPINGPNEYLLETSPDTTAARRRANALTDPNYYVDSTLDARKLSASYQSDPLAAGMSGLLLAGAVIAAIMALVGLLTQAALASRQRATQFAVLRTLGMAGGELARMLLSEQALVYLTGALAGAALSALLAVAALPFLAFSSAAYQPPELGVPSPQLSVNVNGSVVFLAALLLMFALALVISGVGARASGLGKALRVGED